MSNAHPSSKTPLPTPPLPAQQRSRALLTHIAQQASDWFSFDQYMEMALYTPGLGYYSGQAEQFGQTAHAGSDFTTAPEISPFFGYALAQAIAEALQISATSSVMEFGAGTGKLAAQVLKALGALGIRCTSYLIVEVSGPLRARQQAFLEQEVPQYLDCVHWLDTLPEHFEGVVFGNEVLDAMPVKLFTRLEGQWFERGVAWHPAAQAVLHANTPSEVQTGINAVNPDLRDCVALDPAHALIWEDRPASESTELEALCHHLNQARPFDDHALPTPNYLTESHHTACAFLQTVCSMLHKGAVFLIDYGFPAHEYYHPQRHMGTLMCHYQHYAHTNPLWYPGLQDLTAHINFTSLAQAAHPTGATLLGYTSQARFLLNCGILNALNTLDPKHSAHFLPAANGLQKLLAEAEMGELFKVIAFGRGEDIENTTLSAFSQGDRSHRLHLLNPT